MYYLVNGASRRCANTNMKRSQEMDERKAARVRSSSDPKLARSESEPRRNARSVKLGSNVDIVEAVVEEDDVSPTGFKRDKCVSEQAAEFLLEERVNLLLAAHEGN